MRDEGGGSERANLWLPLIALLFAGSGCSALIYEIVWYQLLQLAIGSTSVSLGVLLATFMGGLCIGSLALPRLLPRTRAHPLLIYAGIELLIGLFGLLELALIPGIGEVYIAGPQAGLAGMLMRGLVAGITLLPPTILMGASLPAIARWVEPSERGISWWGLLYGANTAGAVFGCLFAGFYLLRLFDVEIATYAAAGINIAVALASFAVSRFAGPGGVSPSSQPSSPEREKESARYSVHVAIALSGATALGAEVVWTRLMGLTLGATVYAFSIILAVFLFGLALGTAFASSLVNSVNARAGLAWCQMGAAFGIVWAAIMIADWFPHWPINPSLAKDAASTFELDLVRSVWAILPATIFWGASFPFAFAAGARDHDPGATVGGVYAANTAGAIVGALIVSLVLIPWLGTQNTQRALLALSVASALVLLLPRIKEMRSHALELSAGVAFGLALLGVFAIHAVPPELIAYGRRIATNATSDVTILETAEGRNTSIAVSRWSDGAYQFHVAGKVEASTESYDMKLQRMLGHLPALMQGAPKSVLIVGFGAGVTAGSFTRYPEMQRIVICELEPLIPPTSSRYFGKQNYDVASDKRTEIVFDDARHFVATTPEKFDIITSDPIHPFVKGSAALYSREYFEMVKAHLNEGGVVSQWVPLYESDAATVKSEIATFAAVFPYVTLWANLLDGKGYDMVMVGQMQPPKIDLDAIDKRLGSEAYTPVRDSLADVQMMGIDDLFLTYSGDQDGLEPWLKDAAINRDKDLRLQYLAGLALNHTDEDAIYRELRQYWAPPVMLFAGSPARLDAFYTKLTQATDKGGSTASP